LRNKYLFRLLLILPIVILASAQNCGQAPQAILEPNVLNFGEVIYEYTGSTNCKQGEKDMNFKLIATTSKPTVGTFATSNRHFSGSNAKGKFTNSLLGNTDKWDNKIYPSLKARFKPKGLGPLTATMKMDWTATNGKSNEITLKGRGICVEKDKDKDGIPNIYERRSDPNKIDSDGDGIEDGLEDRNRDGLFTNDELDPIKVDTDGDGLNDNVEDKNKNGKKDKGETDGTKKDTDGDSKNDGEDEFPLDPKK